MALQILALDLDPMVTVTRGVILLRTMMMAQEKREEKRNEKKKQMRRTDFLSNRKEMKGKERKKGERKGSHSFSFLFLR
ncbi:hypothetical protein QVD17_00194 [Tagetes erecta]|uniref:Uncharacterized protein n=1 Tax=Tagetes erecta TaxID=13708 RepID=A0AAD8L8B8_TARER|nr:hypothetical protein QVD17_00194 [Tagetes erecta]